MRAKLLGGVVALTLALSMVPQSAGAAQAADGSTDPDTLQQAIDFFYGQPPDEWTPHGTVIADSGFDPAYDAFPFINYGATFGNNALLGYPEGDAVVNLTSLEAQALYGVKQACTSGSGRDCVLSPPMMAWLSTLNNTTFGGGHCFGIAALVAGLFDGVVSRAGLTESLSGVGAPASLRWTSISSETSCR